MDAQGPVDTTAGGAADPLADPAPADAVQLTLDHRGPLDTGGLTPTLNWSYDDLLAAADYPRLVNTKLTFQQVREGRLVAVRQDFVDVEATLEEEASPAG